MREKLELLEGNIEDEIVAVVDVADEHLEIVSSSSESYVSTKLFFWLCWLEFSYTLKNKLIIIYYFMNAILINEKKIP